MAQANPEDDQHNIITNTSINISTSSTCSSTCNNNNNKKTIGFQLNAHAPEFRPTSHHLFIPSNTNNHPYDEMTAISPNYFYVDGTVLSASASSTTTPDWYCVNAAPPSPSGVDQHQSPQSSLSPTFHVLQLKIIKQVEYLFSDLSLLANDTMAKHASKDPQGYVPIPVIASMKKIKVLLTDHHLLAQVLRSSTKLVVSKDGKKVKRRTPFTEHYKEDLQGRTVIVENLPEDHSYQNLEKIFSVVGMVKAIRICHPPDLNPSRSKNEVIISNKLHALVEYENTEMAEKAAESLNDQRNWRKGMRVRVMLRRTPKSVLKGNKSDFDMLTDDDEAAPEETSQLNNADFFGDNIAEEDCGGSGKASVSGRGKTKGQSGRGLLASPTKMAGSPLHLHCDVSPKMINKGPRTPDGSRGFTMGRGKPLIRTCSAPTSPHH